MKVADAVCFYIEGLNGREFTLAEVIQAVPEHPSQSIRNYVYLLTRQGKLCYRRLDRARVYREVAPEAGLFDPPGKAALDAWDRIGRLPRAREVEDDPTLDVPVLALLKAA